MHCKHCLELGIPHVKETGRERERERNAPLDGLILRMHSSSFIHCSIVPARPGSCLSPWIPLVLLFCCGSFDCIVSSWSRVVPDDRAPIPASYPYLSFPLSPTFPSSCVILLFMLLFPSFSHCAHLTYNYVDDIVVYVASVAAAAATAVSFCRSNKEKEKKKGRRSRARRQVLCAFCACCRCRC